MLELDDFRGDAKKPWRCVGLVLVLSKLLHVADAGSFGGGILSYLVLPPSFSTRDRILVSLRFLLNFRLSVEVESIGSTSVGTDFPATLSSLESLGALGPLGLFWLAIRLSSPPYLGCM